jgi:multisubunit Na+/H+ antiporter MnhB subunit
VPLTLISAVYLMWIGSYAPGGAFQAGALLAGAGVLLFAAGFMRPWAPGSPILRAVAAAGLLVFAATALATSLLQGVMLRYPDPAYTWIIGIEAVLTVSIAAVLAELFVDVPAAPTAGRR